MIKSQRQFRYGLNFYGSDVMFFDLVCFFSSNQTYKIKCVKDMQHSSVHVDRESSDSGAAGTVYFYPNMTEQT